MSVDSQELSRQALVAASPPQGSSTSHSALEDKLALALAAVFLAVLYVPVFITLSEKVWNSVEQSYGPVFLATSLWFFWQRRAALASLPTPPRAWSGWLYLLLGIALHVLGASQKSHVLSGLSLIPSCLAVLILLKGWAGVKASALPLVLLLFVVPLPLDIVSALTMPLKIAVSIVATQILVLLDLPVARTGVIMHVGQYQLLVADACAGLTSMFTLEAVGLVYMGIRGKVQRAHDYILGVLLVPIAFVANVIRVLVLVFVTLYFGSEASAGFVHDFAGLFLFAVAGVMMVASDSVLSRFFSQPKITAGAPNA